MELEQCGEDMDKMADLLDEMEELNKNATDLDMTLLDRNIDKMMPELGFSPDDNDQLVAAYRCVVLPQCCCTGTGACLPGLHDGSSPSWQATTVLKRCHRAHTFPLSHTVDLCACSRH